VTADLVREVFGMDCQVIGDPETGTPLVVPAGRQARKRSSRPLAGSSVDVG
jgi:iron complex transport system ATP-binding protein